MVTCSSGGHHHVLLPLARPLVNRFGPLQQAGCLPDIARPRPRRVPHRPRLKPPATAVRSGSATEHPRISGPTVPPSSASSMQPARRRRPPWLRDLRGRAGLPPGASASASVTPMTGDCLLDGDTLSLGEEITTDASRGDCQSSLRTRGPGAGGRARALVDRVAAGEEPTASTPALAPEVRIDRKDLRTLQRNLLLSHAAGGGSMPDRASSCAATSLRRDARHPAALTRVDMASSRSSPEPRRSSAPSGVPPLAHLALGPHRRGEAFVGNDGSARARPARRTGRARGQGGARPRQRHPAMCAVERPPPRRGARRGRRAHDLEVAPPFHGLHPGRAPPPLARWPSTSARSATGVVESHADCSKVQDPSRWCPGARRGATASPRRALHRGERGHRQPAGASTSFSGGNFHGQPVSLALDVWAITCTQLSAISAGWVEQLVNPPLSGLRPRRRTPADSSFMIRPGHLSPWSPSSGCSTGLGGAPSSSAGRRGHVSMAVTTALQGTPGGGVHPELPRPSMPRHSTSRSSRPAGRRPRPTPPVRKVRPPRWRTGRSTANEIKAVRAHRLRERPPRAP